MLSLQLRCWRLPLSRLYHHIVNCSALARDRTDLCNIIGFLPNHLPDLLKDRKSILALHSFLHKAKVSSHHQECTGVSPERENKRQSAQDNLPSSTKKTKTNTSPKVHKRKYNLQSTDCPLMDQVITQRKKKDKKWSTSNLSTSHDTLALARLFPWTYLMYD